MAAEAQRGQGAEYAKGDRGKPAVYAGSLLRNVRKHRHPPRTRASTAGAAQQILTWSSARRAPTPGAVAAVYAGTSQAFSGQMAALRRNDRENGRAACATILSVSLRYERHLLGNVRHGERAEHAVHHG